MTVLKVERRELSSPPRWPSPHSYGAVSGSEDGVNVTYHADALDASGIRGIGPVVGVPRYVRVEFAPVCFGGDGSVASNARL